jgi:hypothetical protein
MTPFLLSLAGCYLLDGASPLDDPAARGPDLVVMVLDNSGSMQEEAEALARSASALVEAVPGASFGLTTTSVIFSGGEDSSGVDRGEAGWFVEDPSADAEALDAQIMCDATCWSSATIASDPSHACGDPLGDEVTVEYLDCLCGVDAWKGHCGSGQEMGLEAGFLALCRAATSVPDACYAFPENAPIGFVEGDEGSNGLSIDDGNGVAVVIVSDEGDDSPRKEGTGDSDVTPYIEGFGAFGVPVSVTVVGPPYDGSNGDCLDGAQPWGVARYQNAASGTGGAYVDLTDAGNDCAVREWSAELAAALADLP